MIEGQLSNQAAVQSTQDIHDVIATDPCKGIKIVAEQTANWDRTQAQNLMTNWLSKGLKFDAVVSNNDEMAIGALQAMKSAGLDTKTAVVGGVDATQDALASMKAGDLKVTVFQNAAGQGKGAVDAALALAAGKPVDKRVYIPFELVTPANSTSTSRRTDGTPWPPCPAGRATTEARLLPARPRPSCRVKRNSVGAGPQRRGGVENKRDEAPWRPSVRQPRKS